nr:d-lactate dehydrogenase [cytochrome], mitochondrial [Quercus suber]
MSTVVKMLEGSMEITPPPFPFEHMVSPNPTANLDNGSNGEDPANEPRRRRASRRATSTSKQAPTNPGADECRRTQARQFHQTQTSNTDGEARRIQAPILTKPRRTSGPSATIGDMCATRCSGSLAVRYGTMRDNVISLKVVLAYGDIVKTASRARKSAAGYDLTRLVIGSEGTLGVITEGTLRLQKIPQHSVVAMCNFPSIKDAGGTLASVIIAGGTIATMMSGIQVSRVELLDEVQVKAINIANGKDFPEIPTLMFEFIGTDPEAKKELWKIRKEALWACFAMEPNFEAMISDVCVPLSHLAELI